MYSFAILYIYIYFWLKRACGFPRSFPFPFLHVRSPSLLMAPPHADLVSFACSVGKLYRKHRRSLPSDVQAATYDLLKELQCFFLPDAVVSFADNISSARKEIGDLVHLFGSLAQRHPAASALIVPPNVDRISTDATTGLLDFVGAWSPLRADAPVFCPSILQPDQGNENTAV